MAKKTIVINRFDGGVANDSREQSSNKVGMCHHMKLFEKTNTAIPHRTVYDVTATDLKIANFVFSGLDVYGLGIVAGGTKVKLYSCDAVSGTTWAAATNGNSTTLTNRDTKAFMVYGGTICGLHGSGRYVWTYVPATTTFTEQAFDAGETSTISTNGIIATDANLYFPRSGTLTPTGACLIKYTGSAWSNAGLVLPETDITQSLENCGSQLALLTSNPGGTTVEDVTKLYLWNLVSEDPDDVIPLGETSYRVLGNVGGYLVAVGINYNTVIETSLECAVFSGGGGVRKYTLLTGLNSSSTIPTLKQLRNGRLYFVINDGDTTNRTYHGIWSLSMEGGVPKVAKELQSYSTGKAGTHNAFAFFNDTFWVSQDTTNFYTSRLYNSATAFATEAYIDTVKYSCGDITRKKRLIGVAVGTTPLPSSSTITLSYKADNDSSFTTIGTNTTTGSVSKEFINIVSTGKNLPEFNEIQFRVNVVGGAGITTIKFKYEELDGLLETK